MRPAIGEQWLGPRERSAERPPRRGCRRQPCRPRPARRSARAAAGAISCASRADPRRWSSVGQGAPFAAFGAIGMNRGTCCRPAAWYDGWHPARRRRHRPPSRRCCAPWRVLGHQIEPNAMAAFTGWRPSGCPIAKTNERWWSLSSSGFHRHEADANLNDHDADVCTAIVVAQ